MGEIYHYNNTCLIKHHISMEKKFSKEKLSLANAYEIWYIYQNLLLSYHKTVIMKCNNETVFVNESLNQFVLSKKLSNW